MESRKLVVVGDIHGNLQAFREVVCGTGLADGPETLNWRAENTVYVQMGDICDRGIESRKIYRAIMQWQQVAPSFGSEVIFILGNHEIMEMFGYDRDASAEEIRGYSDSESSNGYREHQRAFTSGGWLFRWLCEQRGAVQVGRVVFGHGDLPVSFQNRYVEEIHEEVLEDIRIFAADHRTGFHSLPRSLFSEEESIVWSRQSRDTEAYSHALETFLEHNDASLYVCGHTPSVDGNVTVKCDGRYLCVDTAMGFEGRGFGRRSALILEGGVAQIWYFFDGEVDKRKLRLHLN